MPKLPMLAASHIVVSIVLLSGAYACASASTAHWEKAGGGDEHAFQADNDRCGAVASRVSSSACPGGLSACGASAPHNRMDAPPHVDANPIFQRAYMECMADRGWRVAQQ